MIEVERKFALTEESERALTRDAEFVKEKSFLDVYYDTASYLLTTRDLWLRERDRRFELKLPLHGKDRTDFSATRYREIDDETGIRQELEIPMRGEFLDDLEEEGYQPFCYITTVRRKYRKNGFTIDCDTVTSDDDFSYRVGEVEMIVEDESQMGEAQTQIEKFLTDHGIELKLVRGKILEYLKQKRPEHFQALVEAGGIKE